MQNKWKTQRHSDGAERALEGMRLPHPVTVSWQKGLQGKGGGGEGQRRGMQGQEFTRVVTTL